MICILILGEFFLRNFFVRQDHIKLGGIFPKSCKKKFDIEV